MNEFVIEKGVPLPETPPRWKPRYPWREMEPGDSFFVPEGKLKSLQSSAYKVGRDLGRKFAAHPEAGGVRVWRVK
jgi:hypothetical protein